MRWHNVLYVMFVKQITLEFSALALDKLLSREKNEFLLPAAPYKKSNNNNES